MFLLLISGSFADVSEKLLKAVEDNNVLESRLLIKLGGNLESTESWLGKTPLMIAASQNYLEMAELLIEKGAAIDLADRYRATSLHIASQEGHKAALVGQVLLHLPPFGLSLTCQVFDALQVQLERIRGSVPRALNAHHR